MPPSCHLQRRLKWVMLRRIRPLQWGRPSRDGRPECLGNHEDSKRRQRGQHDNGQNELGPPVKCLQPALHFAHRSVPPTPDHELRRFIGTKKLNIFLRYTCSVVGVTLNSQPRTWKIKTQVSDVMPSPTSASR